MFSHLLRSKSIPQHKHFLHSSHGPTQTAKGRDQYHTIFSCLAITLSTVRLPGSPRVLTAKHFNFCTWFAFMFQAPKLRCVCLNGYPRILTVGLRDSCWNAQSKRFGLSPAVFTCSTRGISQCSVMWGHLSNHPSAMSPAVLTLSFGELQWQSEHSVLS